MRLRTQLIINFLVLLVLWNFINFISIRYLLSGNIHNYYRDRGIHLTRSILAECVPMVYYEDLNGMSRFGNLQLQSFPDLRFIIIMSSDGKPVWSSFPDGIPMELMKVVHDSTLKDDIAYTLIKSGNEMMYDYAGKRANVLVRIGMSLAPVENLIQKVSTYLLWISGGGLLVLLAIAVYVSHPVEALLKGIDRATRLGRQTLDDRSLKEIQEVSVLAGRFHDLIKKLEMRTLQLDASRKQMYLGEIAANIAHEINNPLGVIMMNSKLLLERVKKGEMDGSAAREITRLYNTANRVTVIIQKFLQFARYTVKGDKMKLKTVDLHFIINETINMLQDKFNLAGCSCTVNIPPDFSQITCDEQGIQLVLFNLLTNAIDACRPGSWIWVQAGRVKGKIIIKIIDHGTGMTEEVKNHALEPFFTTKPIGQGTGLGLAISNTIVKSHDGSISIDSKTGVGTTVTVEIPA